MIPPQAYECEHGSAFDRMAVACERCPSDLAEVRYRPTMESRENTLSVICEGLATFLISYEDTTGVNGPVWTCAYVDATSEAAALAVIDSWGCDSVDAMVTGIIPDATQIPHAWHLDEETGSIGAASRAEARIFYREQAGDLS